MSYQYRREPLTQEEATRLANACETPQEKIIIWTLLDTGLRVAELAGLTKDNIDWQTHRLTIYDRGSAYGKRSKRRIVPMTSRIQPLLESYFTLQGQFGYSERTIQRVITKVANWAKIKRRVSPHVLRHTYAVTALQKGISIAALQKLLGHDSLATTANLFESLSEGAMEEAKNKR